MSCANLHPKSVNCSASHLPDVGRVSQPAHRYGRSNRTKIQLTHFDTGCFALTSSRLTPRVYSLTAEPAPLLRGQWGFVIPDLILPVDLDLPKAWSSALSAHQLTFTPDHCMLNSIEVKDGPSLASRFVPSHIFKLVGSGINNPHHHKTLLK